MHLELIIPRRDDALTSRLDPGRLESQAIRFACAATDIVAIAERDETVRIISARLMTLRERRAYEQKTDR